MTRAFCVAVAVLLLATFLAPKVVNLSTFRSPAGEKTSANRGETLWLPNGRRITPRGRQLVIAAHPYGMVLSPDQSRLVLSSDGTEPFAITSVQGLREGNPRVLEIKADRERYRKSKTPDENDAEFRSSFMGLAVAKDNTTCYASSGNQGSVFVFDLTTGNRLETISINDSKHRDSFTGELALSADNRILYVLDQANYRLVSIDTASRKLIASVPTGRAPFALSLSPDGASLYVTNVGMFRYSVVDGYSPLNPAATGLTFPPFGLPSREAIEGTTVGKISVPGLGDPTDPQSASVWAYKLSGDGTLAVGGKIRTGRSIGDTEDGARVVGASSPSGVVSGAKFVFVSNANNDSVTVLDRKTEKVRAHISLNILDELASRLKKSGFDLSPSQELTLRRLRGQIPFGLALSPDEKRLYVAEAGINSVAVIDVQKQKVLGHIPVGWFPSQVKVSRDGKVLFVASAKGYGSGPNGGAGFKPGREGTSVGALQKGVVSALDIPADSALADETSAVLSNNGFTLNSSPVDDSVVPGDYGKPSSKIKYIVFITKENRTYDQVYGDLAVDSTGRRLRADPSLARLGESATVYDENSRIALRDVNISPNHHAIARRFASSDNFYLDSDVSADGHRWLVGVYPNAWVETSLAASYGGHRNFRLTPQAPGRLTFAGSAASIAPEDYLEAGSIWEHLFRFSVRFRNYGEGFELAGIEENEDYEPTGARLPVNIPMPTALFDATARDYPTFNMNVSDQFRLKQFLADFRTKYVDGNEEMPAFTNIYLPNDHEAKERPADGYPYRVSYMADNDLALGRILDFLSHTRYWKEMAVFITEDDAQGGLDSVDAHRSLLLVASPWAKKGVSSPQHTSIASILKTVFLLLGLQPLNQYDAAAQDLRDLFTSQADFSPYTALPIDKRIFDEARSLRPGKSRVGQSTRLDDPEDIREVHRKLERERDGR